MTADELRENVRKAMFGPPYRPIAFSTAIVHDVQLNMADAAIRVCMEAAMNGFRTLKPEELITAEMAIDHLDALILGNQQ